MTAAQHVFQHLCCFVLLERVFGERAQVPSPDEILTVSQFCFCSYFALMRIGQTIDLKSALHAGVVRVNVWWCIRKRSVALIYLV